MKEYRRAQLQTLPPGTELYHVHRRRYGALDFNPHAAPDDSWRFSPLVDASGHRIASWYGALRSEGALYETVFRDVCGRRGSAIDRAAVLAERIISRALLTQPVRLLELYGDGLMMLGLKTSFTTSEPRSYGRSRQIAQALYREFPEAQGFLWRSRINNDHFSLVLYKERMADDFATVDEFHPLDNGRGLVMVMDVANRIDCVVN